MQSLLVNKNNRKLEEALRVGNECEELAIGAKIDLQRQSEQMSGKIIRNLKLIQSELTVSGRLMKEIKK